MTNAQELIDRYAAHREGKLHLPDSEVFALEVELADQARHLPAKQALALLKVLHTTEQGVK